MRSLSVTLAVALAIGVAVLLAAWTVQAATLPAPGRGRLAAVDALAALRRYKQVESTLLLRPGREVRANCREGWFPGRGTLLLLSDGKRILDRRHSRLTNRAIVDLELAACPRVLVSRLAHLLQAGARATVSKAGRILAVRFRTGGSGSHLTLYLARRGYLPVGIGIGGARSRLRLG